ncbi:hypothetical protein GCM10009566_04570 [Streptomyces murinus]
MEEPCTGTPHRKQGEGPRSALTPAGGLFIPGRVRQPSFSDDGMYAPGTSFGAYSFFSPGYGLAQLWVWYHV